MSFLSRSWHLEHLAMSQKVVPELKAQIRSRVAILEVDNRLLRYCDSKKKENRTYSTTE